MSQWRGCSDAPAHRCVLAERVLVLSPAAVRLLSSFLCFSRAALFVFDLYNKFVAHSKVSQSAALLQCFQCGFRSLTDVQTFSQRALISCLLFEALGEMSETFITSSLWPRKAV